VYHFIGASVYESCKYKCETCRELGCHRCDNCCINFNSSSTSVTCGILHQKCKQVSQERAYLIMGDESWPIEGGIRYVVDAKTTLFGV
ncbi:unnamed protein product, partial [Prorocentrum cordatum]